MRTEILYEDKSIIVVRKPAGLAVQSAGIGQPDVVSELKSHLAKLPDTGRLGPGKGEPYLGIVHRLDQPVEGVLVFAKEKKAAAALTKQLSDGTLNKHYYAVLCGYPAVAEGELVDYLRKEGSVAVAVTGREKNFPDAKIAKLHYSILEKINQPMPLALALCPKDVKHVWNLSVEEAAAYLKGQTFSAEGEKGWYLICVDDISLGWGKLAGGVMKNHYPKGLRK